MGQYSIVGELRAPLEQVWSLFSDPERWTQWNTEWDTIRDVRGPFDHPGAGYTQVLRILGRERLGTWRVIECEPPFRRRVEGVLPIGAPFRADETFEERDGRTVLRLNLQWETPWGIFGRMLELLLIPLMRRQFADNLRRARALVE
jgi:ligand-binding SRPBCC domain-containing protein